jgi:hypothetical protein
MKKEINNISEFSAEVLIFLPTLLWQRITIILSSSVIFPNFWYKEPEKSTDIIIWMLLWWMVWLPTCQLDVYQQMFVKRFIAAKSTCYLVLSSQNKVLLPLLWILFVISCVVIEYFNFPSLAHTPKQSAINIFMDFTRNVLCRHGIFQFSFLGTHFELQEHRPK